MIESEETEVEKDKLKRQVEGVFRRFGNNDLTPYELRIRQRRKKKMNEELMIKVEEMLAVEFDYVDSIVEDIEFETEREKYLFELGKRLGELGHTKKLYKEASDE